MERRPYDLVVGRAGYNFLLEVKTKKGTLKASQVAFRQFWPGHYWIVRDADEALKAVGL